MKRTIQSLTKQLLLFVASIAALASVALGFDPAQAQSYPEKPIRLVVPSPPGGGTDTLSRLIANKLTERLKWQIVVDNRPGAGGNLGMDIAAKAPPDGYTIVMGETSNLTVNPYLYAKLPFDPAKDLAPIVLVGTVPLVLVSAPARQFESVAAVVAASNVKALTFASGGNGTVGHLAGEIWMRQAGANMRHIPYRGGGPAITDVIGGQVDLNFASIPSAISLIEAGTLKPLAVTSLERSSQFPNVPTLDELGYRGFSAEVLYGLLVPAGTPAAIVQQLNTEINRLLETADMQASLLRVGAKARGGTPDAFAAFLTQERAKWSRGVAESGAKLD